MDELNTLTLSEGNRGNPNVTIISESGLYRLVMRSDKPQARRFQKWVTSEVLPAVRKTGSYGQPKDTLTALNDPAALRGLLLTYSEKVIALQGDVAKLEPVAQVAKDIAASESEHMTLSTAAKACQMRMTDFIRWLHDLGWLASKEKTQEHRNQA